MVIKRLQGIRIFMGFVSLCGWMICTAEHGNAEHGPVEAIAPGRFPVSQQGDVLFAPYLASRPIDVVDPTVTRLICLQHGAARNPFSYLSAMSSGVEVAGEVDQTAVVAFQWLEEKDIQKHLGDTADAKQLLYYSSGWRAGDKSRSTEDHPRPFRISNFEVLDRFLVHAAKQFPNLNSVVVTGHSAGGQVVNRYAIASGSEAMLRNDFGIRVTYVIFNPSSYLYLDDRRWNSESEQFETPGEDVRTAVPNYNRFKYGLENANEYFQRKDRSEMLQTYSQRRVYYAVGDLDNDPDHVDLDKDPAAMLQGDSRLSRGIRYFEHLVAVFGDSIKANQQLVVLPGVGHSSKECFVDPVANRILFGNPPEIPKAAERNMIDGKTMGRWTIVVHGGASSNATMTPERELRVQQGLKAALREGAKVLSDQGSALDAVEAAVKILEDDATFNAGRGAKMTLDGQFELDASIMCGRSLECGGVSAVRTVANPIGLARLVMASTPHLLLSGEGADAFARSVGIAEVSQAYFFDQRTFDLNNARRLELGLEPLVNPALEFSRGTVGAVAMDANGDLAAATSTGGLTGKMAGRIGDSPIIGAGTYARNDVGAISCTGIGEEFMRHAGAFQAILRTRLTDATLSESIEHVLGHEMIPQAGGMIAVTPDGEAIFHFTTDLMSRGYLDSQGKTDIRIRD